MTQDPLHVLWIEPSFPGRLGAVADWLVRRRRTPVQGRLGPAARARNVRGAFAIKAGRSLTGKRVVVIDDVMTTGATVEECARVLKRAGATSVRVLTLARALRLGG